MKITGNIFFGAALEVSERHPLPGLKLASAIFLSATLSACVDLTPVPGHSLSTTPEQRFTDEAINRDLAVFKDMRARIAKIYPSAVSIYAIARADALTEFCAEEYSENDKTGVLEPALDDALRLLVGQERGQTAIDLSLPQLPGISKRRQDLWDKIAAIKQNTEQLNCTGEALARLEVGLLELAHEQYEVDTGLNSAEHTLPAQNRLKALQAKLDDALAACPQASPPLAKPMPKPQHVVFDADLLFPFAKASAQDLSVAGKRRLETLATELLKAPGTWRTMTITGHTDEIGRPEYNYRLGQRRADAIYDYLINRYGLPPEKITTQSMGDKRPVKNCPEIKAIEQRKACLQANRRVEIEWR